MANKDLFAGTSPVDLLLNLILEMDSVAKKNDRLGYYFLSLGGIYSFPDLGTGTFSGAAGP